MILFLYFSEQFYSSLFRLFFHLESVVVDPSFISGDKSIQKILLVLLKLPKQDLGNAHSNACLNQIEQAQSRGVASHVILNSADNIWKIHRLDMHTAKTLTQTDTNDYQTTVKLSNWLNFLRVSYKAWTILITEWWWVKSFSCWDSKHITPSSCVI